MCGVIGYVPGDNYSGPAFARLLYESRIRGQHAYGIYQKRDPHFPCLIRSFNISDIAITFDPFLPAIAHTRYSTSGDWEKLENAQPIVVGDTALAFNGVVSMGTKEEFEAEFGVQCEADNDGEVVMRQEKPIAQFIREMKGSFAGVWLNGGTVWIGRNERRPLWKCNYLGARWVASTRDIFLRAEFPEPEMVKIGVEKL